MIYEFTKSRSTAVAQIEPELIRVTKRTANTGWQLEPSYITTKSQLEYDMKYGNLANDMVGFKIPDLSWLKLNGV